MRIAVVALVCAGLAACASAPRKPDAAPVAGAPAPVAAAPDPCEGRRHAPAVEDLTKRGDYVAGGLFRPGERDSIPAALPAIECIPEPEVVALERSRLGNRPVYTVLDREYRVLDDTRGFAEEGLASYYGQKFHGRRTSNWEVYDMYAFTAAHKTLPLPSFARVTNVENGRSVIVRVNDRGPFHEGRVMDLSFAAAVKLGIYPAGTGRVRVEAVHPGEPAAQPTYAGRSAPAAPAAPAAAHRFDMQRGGRAATADEFDAWMKQRDVRVATGQPIAVDVAEPPVAVEELPAPAAPALEARSGATAPASALVVQVASFSTRDNADRALATLQRAGIAGARVLPAEVGGQPVWRLRVVTAGTEPDLIARLAGLGFGSARRVRE